jgi:hypothetical protein
MSVNTVYVFAILPERVMALRWAQLGAAPFLLPPLPTLVLITRTQRTAQTSPYPDNPQGARGLGRQAPLIRSCWGTLKQGEPGTERRRGCVTMASCGRR